MVPPPLRPPPPQRQRSLSTTSLSPAPVPLSPAYSYARQYLSLLDATETFSLDREQRTAAVQRARTERERREGEIREIRHRVEVTPNDLSMRMRLHEMEEEYRKLVQREEQAKEALNSPSIVGTFLFSTPSSRSLRG